jgi:membrane protease YdiL (CAAX protease family)
MYPWRSFLIVSVAAANGAVLSLPFPPRLREAVVAALVMVAIVGAGIVAATRTHLWKTSQEQALNLRVLIRAALIGSLLGGSFVALLTLLSRGLPVIGVRLAAEANWPVWRRVLLAAEAAVTEESLFRLFLLSMLVWAVTSISKARRAKPATVFWICNSVVALAFGLAHLPSWSRLVPLTPAIIVTVLFLNGVAGLVLGYTYWRHGLLAAITLHFAADTVVHSIGPLLLRHPGAA